MCPQRPLEDGEGDGEGVVGADGLADGEDPAVGVPWWWLNFSTYVTPAAASTSATPTATSRRSLPPPWRARLPRGAPRGGPPAAGAAVSFSAVVLAAGAAWAAPVALAVLVPVAAATGAARPGQDDADPVASSSAGHGWIEGTSMDGG